jgi:Mg2+-importing ATPase
MTLPTFMPQPKKPTFSETLFNSGQAAPADLLSQLSSSEAGLSEEEAEERLEKYGRNEVAREKRKPAYVKLWTYIKDPLVLLLAALAIISVITQDYRAAVVITIMIVLGIVLRYFQETRADDAAEKLKEMVSTTCTVLRSGEKKEIPLAEVVPGDIIQLSAGDMIPADLRMLSSKDLFVTQSALTGESMPVEKFAALSEGPKTTPLEMENIAFMGTNVESGSGIAVVVETGQSTYFGSLAVSIVGQRQLTSFDKGINSFTTLMLRFMAVMVPAVFLINGITKHDWLQAFLFAVAVAVGMTPEMLPMIVTVNLSRGALAMSKKKVIVKRLNSIQNFGAMDTLCTDKTGTITDGHIVLVKYLDLKGNENDHVLKFAYLNSYFQTGLKNLLDEAVLEFRNLEAEMQVAEEYCKIDELPFDFNRKRMSVVLEDHTGANILICKGAVEEVMSHCKYVEILGEVLEREPEHDKHREERVRKLNEDGFRVVAVAYKMIPDGPDTPTYSVADESDMVLLGFLGFLDPPKESAKKTLAELGNLKVAVKILTGDNEVVSRRICSQVGLNVENILLGPDIEKMSEGELAEAAENTTVFAKLSPAHKEQIIGALHSRGHVIGYMGDGINDAPALRAADVGISVNTAVDIAKESSDIILLENSLLVLEDGVLEGRRVFGNIVKYIKMAASSSFGNMFSMVGGSAFLPFLPMSPLQVLTNNLLYDFSQVPIPTDNVDEDWLVRPRKWAIDDIRRFILYIGPISSIFDYLTFFVMLYVFNSWNNPALFHTGWFVESIFTQTLIIHVIRTKKIPFIQSRASTPIILTSIGIVIFGAWLTVSPFASTLGFVPLPALYWPILLVMMIAYVLLTQLVKTWYYKKFGD